MQHPHRDEALQYHQIHQVDQHDAPIKDFAKAQAQTPVQSTINRVCSIQQNHDELSSDNDLIEESKRQMAAKRMRDKLRFEESIKDSAVIAALHEMRQMHGVGRKNRLPAWIIKNSEQQIRVLFDCFQREVDKAGRGDGVVWLYFLMTGEDEEGLIPLVAAIEKGEPDVIDLLFDCSARWLGRLCVAGYLARKAAEEGGSVACLERCERGRHILIDAINTNSYSVVEKVVERCAKLSPGCIFSLRQLLLQSCPRSLGMAPLAYALKTNRYSAALAMVSVILRLGKAAQLGRDQASSISASQKLLNDILDKPGCSDQASARDLLYNLQCCDQMEAELIAKCRTLVGECCATDLDGAGKTCCNVCDEGETVQERVSLRC